ncbi:hypothetical protein HK096_011411 [Nowakowskiella sp. JEL0078]|nr:hypothetical protein HK096_011411 [Nowakowskiella sp. JEL0078]
MSLIPIAINTVYSYDLTLAARDSLSAVAVLTNFIATVLMAIVTVRKTVLGVSDFVKKRKETAKLKSENQTLSQPLLTANNLPSQPPNHFSTTEQSHSGYPAPQSQIYYPSTQYSSPIYPFTQNTTQVYPPQQIIQTYPGQQTYLPTVSANVVSNYAPLQTSQMYHGQPMQYVPTQFTSDHLAIQPTINLNHQNIAEQSVTHEPSQVISQQPVVSIPPVQSAPISSTSH